MDGNFHFLFHHHESSVLSDLSITLMHFSDTMAVRWSVRTASSAVPPGASAFVQGTVLRLFPTEYLDGSGDAALR